VTQVQTVLGPIDTSELGTTLMHEHVFLIQPEIAINYPERFDVEADDARVHHELAELKASGVDTIVDLTVIGLGRDVARVRRVVEGTGLNVIVAAGVYTFDELAFFFKNWGPGTINGGPPILESCFTQDIEQGIAGTGIRAGILKTVTDVKGLTPDIERLLRAIARVHRDTGVPITTHTHAATRRGIDQQTIFRQEGVDLSRVIIGHSGDTTDISYLTALMDAGSYIGMDRFGLETVLDDDSRIRTLVTLVELGYASKMVLSHDVSCCTQSFSEEAKATHLPRWTLQSVTSEIVPRLLDAGVSADAVHQMLVTNPAEIFSRVEPYPS
jgi:phosphotriesterase-related protein